MEAIPHFHLREIDFELFVRRCRRGQSDRSALTELLSIFSRCDEETFDIDIDRCSLFTFVDVLNVDQ